MRTIIRPEDISDNAFTLIGDDWMLITAGPPSAYNTMTASWGGFGVLWGKPVCWCVIRPQRYTAEFMERADAFTLSFFDERHRSALQLCGSKSGREVDKAAATGLTPVGGSVARTTYFAEARLVLTCRKIYYQDIDPAHFVDSSLDEFYPNRDYHRMYLGEVVEVSEAP
jgi:flavin reductase (DIM6/NTAB) family NADH-FMN oxidoreductase RutF